MIIRVGVIVHVLHLVMSVTQKIIFAIERAKSTTREQRSTGDGAYVQPELRVERDGRARRGGRLSIQAALRTCSARAGDHTAQTAAATPGRPGAAHSSKETTGEEG